MAPSTFHKFPRLPAELRLKIWGLAIRPSGYGLHRFCIVDIFSDDGPNDPLLNLVLVDHNEATWNSGLGFAAPVVRRGHPDQRYSWTEGNNSVYLWDAGLWNACKESRDVVEKRRRREEGSGEDGHQQTAIAIARLRGEELHLVVDPYSDLFCLEPEDWGDCIYWWSLGLEPSIFSHGRGICWLSNVAVEFDSSWNVDLPVTGQLGDLLHESTPRGFVARAVSDFLFKGVRGCTLWLIDLGLRRPEERVAEDRQLPPYHVFYDSDGGRYCEAFSYRSGIWNDTKDTAQYFIDWIDDKGLAQYATVPARSRARVFVLAYEAGA